MKNRRIELIYAQGCPNIETARSQLLRAFQLLDQSPHWLEWEVSHADTPAYARNYGSPTILVNGIDVASDTLRGEAVCCRIYTDKDGKSSGIPLLEDIVRALS